MIDDPMNEGSQNSETELRAALLDHCRLSAAAVAQISEVMHASGLTFCDSALQLQLITQEDIDACTAWLSRSATEEKESLVQEAIRKLSSQRQVIVRPRETVRPGAQLELARDSYNPRSELIRSLRTELLLRAGPSGTIALCVVSPSPQEGRSQLAAELAISFAQLERRTLLVDADMRKPTQHLLFQAGNERGLGDALTRGDKPHQYGIEGLPQMSLITSGLLPANPLELLSGKQFERLLSEWRNNFDFVIIDTPPVTTSADALAIASLTGSALLVTRAERTTYKSMRELTRRIAGTRASILGSAINRF